VFFHPILIHGSGANRTQGFRKAISCHYSCAERVFIDIRGTTQEGVVREIEELFKKFNVTMDIKVFVLEKVLKSSDPISLKLFLLA
jgi:phytanoyl-CoA hydroxylase